MLVDQQEINSALNLTTFLLPSTDNNKGGTFPLENKTIGDVYRNKFSAENGERGDVQYSYERQLSDQQYSERTPDIR